MNAVTRGKGRCQSAIATRQPTYQSRRPRLLSAKDIRSTLSISTPVLYRPKYAYFTMVLTDESLPGALLLGWSLKKTATQYDVVVMVTAEIGNRVRASLKKVFDRVVVVDIIETIRQPFTKSRLLSENERRLFSRKMTKGNLFRFIEYEKILFVENSLYFLQNIDELFELQTPAGILSLIDAANQEMYHGIHLSRDHVIKSMQVSRGIRSTMMLLKPSTSLYHYCHANGRRHSSNNFICPDEEFFTKLFLGQWTHIHFKYASVRWQVNKLNREVLGVSLESLQPWDDDCKRIEYISQWRLFAVEMCKDIPFLRRIFKHMKWYNNNSDRQSVAITNLIPNL